MAHGVRPIDKEKFYEAYRAFMNGCSLTKASKIAGISVPTLKKYFEVELTGGEFPDTLFKD